MTDYEKLAVAAEEVAPWTEQQGMPLTAILLRSLAAALRELAPPDGWMVTEYLHELGWVYSQKSGVWWAMSRTSCEYGPFSTAATAMAALDKESDET